VSRPSEGAKVGERFDESHGMRRTAISLGLGGSHPAHHFPDGSVPKGGMRCCFSWASLRFIYLKDLDAQGYREYRHLFENEGKA
jgi:peptide-methionine (R)-S-oxide reductase